MTREELCALVRRYSKWGRSVVAHCERMNFNTREEEWIKQDLDAIEKDL